MTHAPVSGTDTGLPALYRYLNELQDKACLLNGLLEAAKHLELAEECENGRTCIVQIAEKLSVEIYNGLDTMHLLQVGKRANG